MFAAYRRVFAYLVPYWRRLILVLVISLLSTALAQAGMPEGDHTLAQFMQIIRTGIDLDNAHPNCSNLINTNCLSAPFDGSKLQVMPWPNFQNMTDRQITAIYTYLSAIPCLEGGPGEKPGRCQ